MNRKKIQDEINNLESSEIELISDKYHNFKTLYDFRKMYNAALFNEWARGYLTSKKLIKQGILDSMIIDQPKFNVHKSKKHFDGESPFGKEDWFIVCAMLPTGQISNHYPMEDWDLFKIPETEKALFEFDGHTSEDVLERLKNL